MGARPFRSSTREILATKAKTEKTKGSGCKDTTYVGTWNVRTLYSAGQLDVLLHQLRGVTWSIMGPLRDEMDGIRRTRQGSLQDYLLGKTGQQAPGKSRAHLEEGGSKRHDWIRSIKTTHNKGKIQNIKRKGNSYTSICTEIELYGGRDRRLLYRTARGNGEYAKPGSYYSDG